MSSWLRNIQGQLSELASEVLNEATEEVSDPGSELQVIRRKLVQTEKELEGEKENVGRLQKKIGSLEEELYAKNLEFDTLNAKYAGMVESRDDQIRGLQESLERLRHSEKRISVGDGDDDEGLFSEGSTRIARLKDEIGQLKKEVVHWKRLVNEESKQDSVKKVAELERIIVEQKSKYESEIAALIVAHSETVAQLKSQNESIEDDEIGKDGSDDTVLRSGPFNSDNDFLKEQIQSLTEERDSLLSKIMSVKKENAVQAEQVDELTLQAVDKVLSEQLLEMQKHCKDLQEKLDAGEILINEKNSQLSQLQAEVEEAHKLIDTQREKFEHEISEERKRSRLISEAMDKLNKDLETWQKRVEISETIFEEQQIAKDQEMEKLRRENAELALAYNDLNEEFENHKAEHGSVVVSNRDLTARIDALKANLIEYEERYELCKNENAETVQQLEKLSHDFDRLRLSFENSKTRNASDAVDEVERLRTELDASKDDREKLRADVERFRSAIGIIDTELNRLRESNDKLVEDNKAMGASLNRFAEIRDMLENSDSELKNLREKFLQLQNEHELKEQEWREQLAVLSEARDDAKRQLEECQREVAERRMCSSGGTPSTEIVDIKSDQSEGKAATSSEGTVDSNNGWEKMTDWDATGMVNESSTNSQNNSTILDELREALAMVTEKTEECEELRRQKYELEKETDLRQTCIDEMMAQMNVLQSQQRLQAETFTQLRDWASELEREKMNLERNLIHAEEKLQEMQKQLGLVKAEKGEMKNDSSADEMQQIKEISENKGGQSGVQSESALLLENKEIEITKKLSVPADQVNEACDQKENHGENLSGTKTEASNLILQMEQAAQREKNLEERNEKIQHELNKAIEQLEEHKNIRKQLIALVEQKHAESVNYHAQLQALFMERDEHKLTIAGILEKTSILEQELKSSTETRDKALKECERLRDHLVTVEETSTREAVAAEERETELRQQIRILEQKIEESAETVIDSANAYQKRIAELTDELDLIRTENAATVEKLQEREKTLYDTKTALSNLQNVLRDIGVDHESQITQYESDIADLKRNVEELKLEIVQLRQAQVVLETEKHSLEDGTVHLKEEISRRDTLIEELEASLDDRAQVAGASTSSRIIDDHVLRQLFLSYFTADKDKQPEIAILLASVLGYSQEDIAKISAANQSSSRGWFGFGSSSRTSQPNISLAEQFVRFLEKESVTTLHSLPVQRSEEKETMRSSGISLKPSSPSSSMDLQSILNA